VATFLNRCRAFDLLRHCARVNSDGSLHSHLVLLLVELEDFADFVFVDELAEVKLHFADFRPFFRRTVIRTVVAEFELALLFLPLIFLLAVRNPKTSHKCLVQVNS